MLLSVVRAQGTRRPWGPVGSCRSYSVDSHRQPRHFLALWTWCCVLTDQTLDAIVALQEKLSEDLNESKIKWVPRENIHLTVHFYGPQLAKPEDLEAAKRAATKAMSSTSPFTLSLRTLGVHPKMAKPRVNKIKSLARKMENRLKEEGLSLNLKHAQAHITIGRWSDVYVKKISGRSVANVVSGYSSPIAEWKVNDWKLIDSHLGVPHPSYVAVHTAEALGES